VEKPAKLKRRTLDARVGQELKTAHIRLSGQTLHHAKQVEEAIGVSVTFKALLLQAVTHRSYLQEHREFPLGDSERLEYLGDAVMGLVVREHLLSTYPLSENILTELASRLVCHETVSEVAYELGLLPLLLMGRDMDRDGRRRSRQLEDVFEAIVGALYLDQGLEGASSFLKRHLLSRIPEFFRDGGHLDPKSHLQQYTSQQLGCVPRYDLVGSDWPHYQQAHTWTVCVNDEELGRGTGSSHKEAQMAAARQALAFYEQQEQAVAATP
jgi:ribonuclease-3